MIAKNVFGLLKDNRKSKLKGLFGDVFDEQGDEVKAMPETQAKGAPVTASDALMGSDLMTAEKVGKKRNMKSRSATAAQILF